MTAHLSRAAALALALAGCAQAERRGASAPCDPGDGGITLAPGFCARVFADSVGVARHLVVTDGGDVYVALEDADEASGGSTQMRGELGRGGIVALRDADGDGRAEQREYLRRRGGSGIGVRGTHLYVSTPSEVLRYRLAAGRLLPAGEPDTLVSVFPDTGWHFSRSLALDGAGGIYVNVGSATNACAVLADGKPRGLDPCPELADRAGVWRYDARRVGQRHPGGGPYTTGVRNAMALAWNPDAGALYAVLNGRGGLHQNFPEHFTAQQGADKPSEEFVRLRPGADLQWPFCYHDAELGRRVLAPEYGGDGRRAGRCGSEDLPLLAFPAHWSPLGLLFYGGERFPARYRGGAFVAFHGSGSRRPLPEEEGRVMFVPMRDGRPAGPPETFASGFAGPVATPAGALHRPVGLAQSRQGVLYLSDDQRGRIWRIDYAGASRGTSSSSTRRTASSGSPVLSTRITSAPVAKPPPKSTS